MSNYAAGPAGAAATATGAVQTAGGATSNDGDGQANFVGASDVMAHQYAYNGATWDRVHITADNSDGQGVNGTGLLPAVARLFGFTGAAWDRLRVVAAQGDGLGVAAAMQPSATYGTAAATAATATTTFAAVLGQAHRLTSAHAAYTATPVSAGVASIVDGASTVLAWLGSSTPNPPVVPPSGGMKASAVNQALSVSLASGGAAISGYVFATKLTA